MTKFLGEKAQESGSVS